MIMKREIQSGMTPEERNQSHLLCLKTGAMRKIAE